MEYHQTKIQNAAYVEVDQRTSRLLMPTLQPLGLSQRVHPLGVILRSKQTPKSKLALMYVEYSKAEILTEECASVQIGT
jgi:hypothetical protein